MSLETKLFTVLLIAGQTHIVQSLPGVRKVITVEFAKAVWIRGHRSLQTVVNVSRYKGLSHRFWALTRVNRTLPMILFSVKQVIN